MRHLLLAVGATVPPALSAMAIDTPHVWVEGHGVRTLHYHAPRLLFPLLETWSPRQIGAGAFAVVFLATLAWTLNRRVRCRAHEIVLTFLASFGACFVGGVLLGRAFPLG